MRDLHHLSRRRVRRGPLASQDSDGKYGAFAIPLGRRQTAVVIAAGGEETGWEHVSVHVRVASPGGRTRPRTPTWEEMARIKDLFFAEDETVVQYHPPKADYVDLHPHTLHLWRPSGLALPRPPSILV